MTNAIITFGEALYRLTPPHQQRFTQASSLELHVGGAEANVAVGLAHLGLDVAFVSRLTDNPLGRRIEQTLRGYGVQTQITWTSSDRVGLYFVEDASPPRSSQVIYDRANSAFANIQPHDLPLDSLNLTDKSWLHTTGITLALGEPARQTTGTLRDSLQKAGGHLSFDVNYRAKLWTCDEARIVCEPFLQCAELIFIAERDARHLFNFDGDASDVIKVLWKRYPQSTLIMSRGAQGVMAISTSGELHEKPIIPASGIGRIGGGDALASGCLYAHLQQKTLEETLSWGIASASLKYATLGDMPLITRSEIEHLLASNHDGGIQR